MRSEQNCNSLKVDIAVLRSKIRRLNRVVEQLRETNGILRTSEIPAPCTDIPAILAGIGRPLHSHVASTPPCVYFLLRGDEVIYVGQSTALGARLAAHATEGRHFTRVLFTPVPPADLNMVEVAMISRFKPRLNRSPGPSLPKEVRAQMEVQNALCLS